MAREKFVWLHAVDSLVRLELDAAERFFRFSELRFLREAEKLRKEEKVHPDSYWKEDLEFGATRGDFLADEFGEVREMQQLNRYFGVILVYSTLERFLFVIFRSAKRLKLIREPAFEKKRYLDFGRYVQVLKDIGVDLPRRKKEYAALHKLLNIRNAIAHYGGWVHSGIAPKLKQYKFEEHQRIELDEDYFLEVKELVQDECLFISNSYRKLVRRREALRPGGGHKI